MSQTKDNGIHSFSKSWSFLFSSFFSSCSSRRQSFKSWISRLSVTIQSANLSLTGNLIRNWRIHKNCWTSHFDSTSKCTWSNLFARVCICVLWATKSWRRWSSVASFVAFSSKRPLTNVNSIHFRRNAIHLSKVILLYGSYLIWDSKSLIFFE